MAQHMLHNSEGIAIKVEAQSPQITPLTLKLLGIFVQIEILISDGIYHRCNISVWNWYKTINFIQHCGYWWPGALAPGQQ